MIFNKKETEKIELVARPSASNWRSCLRVGRQGVDPERGRVTVVVLDRFGTVRGRGVVTPMHVLLDTPSTGGSPGAGMGRGRLTSLLEVGGGLEHVTG